MKPTREETVRALTEMFSTKTGLELLGAIEQVADAIHAEPSRQTREQFIQRWNGADDTPATRLKLLADAIYGSEEPTPAKPSWSLTGSVKVGFDSEGHLRGPEANRPEIPDSHNHSETPKSSHKFNVGDRIIQSGKGIRPDAGVVVKVDRTGSGLEYCINLDRDGEGDNWRSADELAPEPVRDEEPFTSVERASRVAELEVLDEVSTVVERVLTVEQVSELYREAIVNLNSPCATFGAPTVMNLIATSRAAESSLAEAIARAEAAEAKLDALQKDRDYWRHMALDDPEVPEPVYPLTEAYRMSVEDMRTDARVKEAVEAERAWTLQECERERDEYELGGECYKTVDDVVDIMRERLGDASSYNIQQMVRDAVVAEREVCAVIATTPAFSYLADRIRARGGK